MRKIFAFILLIVLLASAPAMATVATSTSRIQYACSGSGTTYTFSFGVGTTTEIQVILTDSAGTETTLTATTHYSVSCTNNDCTSGGTVTTVATYAAGNKITVLRNVPLTQESDFTEGMPTLYETFESGLDKLTRIAQQQQEYFERIPKLPRSSSLTNLTFPVPGAGQYLRWNAGGTALEATTAVLDSGNYLDSGTGATTRAVSAKLGDIRSVKDFGATGDRVTDDTAAFTAAIAATSALFVPCGNYVANITISGKTGFLLYGAGYCSQISPASGTGIQVTSGTRVEIDSLYVSGGATGLRFDGNVRGRARHMYFTGQTATGVYIDGDDSTEITLDDVYVADMGGAGIGVDYERTTTTDTGGLYLRNVIVVKGSGSGVTGYKFNSTQGAGTAGYVFADGLVADGFSDYAIYIREIANVRIVNFYATTAVASKGALHLYDAVQAQFVNGWITNTDVDGHAIYMDHACTGVQMDLIQTVAGTTSGYGIYFNDTGHTNVWVGANWINWAGFGRYNAAYLSHGTALVQHILSTTTWNPGSINDGAQETTTGVTVSGVALGDACVVGFSQALSDGMILSCHVTASNTAKAVLFNKSGAPVDLDSGTLTFHVYKVR